MCFERGIPLRMAGGGEKVCTECGQAMEQGNSGGSHGCYRCGKCNRLRSRITRLFSKLSDEQKNAFANIPKEEKHKWFSDNHEKIGKDLSAALQEVVSFEIKEEVFTEFKGTGKFFDEEDLKDKYAKKPKQLAAILKNARKVECPVREVTLFEDMEYVSVDSKSNKTSEVQKRSIVQDREEKKTKKVKTEPTEPKAAKASEPKQFSEAQVKALAKMESAATGAMGKLDKFFVEINEKGLEGLVNTAVVDKAKAFRCKIAEVVAVIGGSVQRGSGDMAEMRTLTSEIKEAVKEHLRRLCVQIEEAEAMKEDGA